MAHNPSPLRSTRSLPRSDPPFPPAEPSPRSKRASTLQSVSTSTPAAESRRTASGTQLDRQVSETDAPDTFERRISEETAEAPRASVDLDELPIELISLADRFIDQLSAKVWPTPPNIDNIARLFQDFYATAATHIQTHVDSLATRQRREASPAPSNTSRASTASLLRAKAASLGSKEKSKAPSRRDSEQMLTADEYANRKKARKALDQKRVTLEEAIERRLCEGIYDKIYRHHTTQDEAQDDKLRSKTAALNVVGIGPVDLGIEIGAKDPESAAQKQDEVKNWLEQARQELILMNQSRYPLGKLNHLKAAHKSIIDTLSHFHPSSSADELMPMLIYTLITLPPENLNVISDVNFIQRFRWEPKLVGEAAYCLTNLEATISFLETVDLSTLRADEAPTGPLKGSASPGTTKVETFPPAYSPGSSTTALGLSETGASPVGTAMKPGPSAAGLRAAMQIRNRRLSDLVNTPAQAFNAASDAVLNTADQGLKTIGTSLGDSYKFLLGKLRDHPEALTNQGGEVIVPKTLDDARKLIGTPPPDEDDGSASGTSSIHSPEETTTDKLPQRTATPRDDKVLNFIGGRKVSRDHSADSARSAGSLRKAADEQQQQQYIKDRATTSSPITSPSSSNPALLDSVRNLGNSLNPMARLTGIGSFRGFGRSNNSASPVPAPLPKDTPPLRSPADGVDLATVFPELAPVLPPKEAPKVNPPIKRFMEIQSPADLRIGEVLELLRDYRRLAGALKDLGAIKE
ncbi:hypothetical protein B0T26DRAFT_678523 [Lasiosphaeria miniovina]|uniref:VPS9 domain-containing protein n=1 Tax=Lasiosphaeria miniovina TaxID=1954250 RepID=A0AA40A4E5_9PEZI|nr:uncharacterized protein B0T26DRAFT_678523 [Lasiosphaeria miniovina]KAK0709047.1 hypothetical protein B0T26DRAFT_678523 [Lasiosphaeria miniovina]